MTALMSAHTWLWIVLVVEGLAFAGCLGVLVGRAAWQRWEALRLEPRITAVRIDLMHALETGAAEGDDLNAAKTLPLRARIKLIVDLAGNLSGARLKEIATIAKQLDIVTHGEQLCRSRLWSKRVGGIRLLTVLAEGEQIIPSLFRDPSAIVRSEVVNWAADHPSQDIIDAVLRCLDDADGFVRFAAHNAVHRMGAAVVAPLGRYIESQTGAALERAMAVAASLGYEQFGAVARTLIDHSSSAVRKLAVDTLAKSGDLQSAPLVIDRLKDPAPQVRQAAARTLGHLHCWQAASALCRQLEDPVWAVRLEAALTLRSLGAPGLLMLRRSLTSSDRFAADMARHVLGLPSMKVRMESA
jgi:hypothetical protein